MKVDRFITPINPGSFGRNLFRGISCLMFLLLSVSLWAGPASWESVGPDGGHILGSATHSTDPNMVAVITRNPSEAAVFRSNNGGGVEAGPEFGLRTKASDIFTASITDKEDLELKVNIRDELVRINAGMAFGFSKNLGKGPLYR